MKIKEFIISAKLKGGGSIKLSAYGSNPFDAYKDELYRLKTIIGDAAISSVDIVEKPKNNRLG